MYGVSAGGASEAREPKKALDHAKHWNAAKCKQSAESDVFVFSKIGSLGPFTALSRTIVNNVKFLVEMLYAANCIPES